MKWLLIAVVIIVMLAVIGLFVNLLSGAWWTVRSIFRRPVKRSLMELPEPRCLACHGTGWTNQQPERTFTFIGDSFEDVHSPATMCAVCGGSGISQIHRS